MHNNNKNTNNNTNTNINTATTTSNDDDDDAAKHSSLICDKSSPALKMVPEMHGVTTLKRLEA